ncbi:MAG: right-handed parallel beta-helix repeat-containing protein, partial [Mariniphaga sp.]|nr:right-handed parallel beta-helix repeat-containing protein [Mariniphaga sp.]
VEGTGVQAFLITNGETRGSVVDGFNIINGCWVIIIDQSSPTIKNNILESNNRGVHCVGVLSDPLIENNVISKSNDEGIYIERSKGIIRNNTIKRSMYSSNFGNLSMSGIHCNMASPIIKDNDIEWSFYGIYNRNGSNPQIEGNIVKYSFSYGIYCNGSSPQIFENQIIENENTGIYCENSSPQISSNLIRKNGGTRFSSTSTGVYDQHNRLSEIYVGGTNEGGISINNNSNPNIRNNIIIENKGLNVGAIFCDDTSAPIMVNNHIINNSSIKGGSVSVKNATAKIVNNIITGARSSDTHLGVSRWYKDDLFAWYDYDGVILKNVIYYFGFINYGPPGDIHISGCTGLDQTVWAETGERFWVEVASRVLSGWYGGLSVTVSSDLNSFAISEKRVVNFVPHGCSSVFSPEIISYGTSDEEGLVRAGIIIPNQGNVPEIAYNNVYGNPGGNYIFSDSVETKSAQVFDLTGTDGNISSDPLLDSLTYELLEGSPCIDAGTPDTTDLSIGLTDYLGNLRILNNIIDIGAVESHSVSIETDEYVSICQGEEYEGHSESGEFQRTLTSATGIDSIVTTYLTVNPTYASEEFVSICEGENYLGITEPGGYTRVFETINGCDSTVLTHLTIMEVYNDVEYVSICEGDNYLGFTEAGQHQRELEAVTGCDSLVITFLTVNPVFYIVEDTSICVGDEYFGFTTEGQHQRTLQTVNGCDSIVVTNLSIYPPFKPTFTHNDIQNTLTSNENYDEYQWYYENVEIDGATSKTYTYTQDGNYFLEATKNGCTYSSELINTPAIRLEKYDFSNSIMPNPNRGEFSFRIDSNPPEKLSVKLINGLGQVMEVREIEYPVANQIEHFNVSHLSKGIYHFVVTNEKNVTSQKIIIQ